MKQAIILHGTCDQEEYYSDIYPSLSNSHWIPWLQKQLLIRDFSVTTPEMYHAYIPDYTLWSRELEKYITPETEVLVGHSCGGGFLVRWLSEHPSYTPRIVVLVAPWLDPDDTRENLFFDFQIDPSLSTRSRIVIFESDDDMEDIRESIQILRQNLL